MISKIQMFTSLLALCQNIYSAMSFCYTFLSNKKIHYKLEVSFPKKAKPLIVIQLKKQQNLNWIFCLKQLGRYGKKSWSTC